jgi:hypothetical protein
MSHSEQDYIDAAAQHPLVSGGQLEVDSNAEVSISEDGGAYVQAWLWIDDSEVG